MVQALLDTNIIIYLAQENEKFSRFFSELHYDFFGISVLSHLEATLGIQKQKNSQLLQQILNEMLTLPLTKEISEKSAKSFKKKEIKNLKHPQMPDILIAHTALHYNIPLITNNPKDFKIFKELEIITP
jgi:predicted nucleic acid-binding protein